MSKRPAGKITLSMLKGKPITTSVPSFSFRFNAEDEELEELHPEEHLELPEVPEEQVSGGASHSPVHSSTPHNPSTSRDPSPMHKVVKRSASLEDSTGSSNTMRLFNELKGKITKTVEEKLSEIKSEKKNKTVEEKRKMLTSKESSSVSDSEECTAPSTGRIDDQSPSLQSTVPSTPGTATPELEVSLPIDIPNAEAMAEEPDFPMDSSTPKKSLPTTLEAPFKSKGRPKITSELRRRKKSTSNDVMTMSKIGDPYGEDDEIESAVEVNEESNLSEQSVAKIEQPAPNKDIKDTSWSYSGNLLHLLGQRTVQVTLAWPIFCVLLPVPNFLRDFVLGALVMHCFYTAFQWLTEPVPSEPEKPLLIPDFSALPILKVPSVKEHSPVTRFEGWMNEFPSEYNPETYLINQTRSVFVRLDGSMLRISLTRQKVRKRAMWNEPPPRRNFYHQRIFDIAKCTIKLLPDGLARKRMWSKKYPICIMLRRDSRIGITIPENDSFKEVVDDHAEDEEFEEENSEDETFCLVTNSMVDQQQLILFARTDREKDEWLRRLVAASKCLSTPDQEDSVTPSVESSNVPELRVSPQGTPEHRPLSLEVELHQHISKFLQQTSSTSGSLSSSPKNSPVGSPVKCPLNKAPETIKESEELPSVGIPPPPADTAWFNALLSRVLFDVLRDSQWSEWVRDRIQRKLSTVRLPTFMEELTVSELDLGTALPVVHRTSSPHMDNRGLWVDLDVSYEGSAKICVETKLNLVKLTKADSLESSSGSNKDGPSLATIEAVQRKTIGKSPIFDSDLEDSAESSSDEDTNEVSADDNSAPGAGSSGMGKMLFRMATKITTSKYFQQASEISYIRRAMEEMSNTRVMVHVELKALVGVLAINIPPPPSDRLWYGFRGNPELRLAAKAKLGERLVTLSQVTDFIENKLCIEFQKVFVLPNMDELIIPVMNGRVPQ
ncbi:testis-expressed protein 2 isoform X2 [Neocloeon triangulifer]|uniref:testis-expressed protein 2 isoform X2 n=1 Tax=Neocloeon triangulifer TaxID=2078957 RepID=UPI00286EDD5E|nr:testis-expressed protein 2 isoform X2 [Neocloeon triangulifer]